MPTREPQWGYAGSWPLGFAAALPAPPPPSRHEPVGEGLREGGFTRPWSACSTIAWSTGAQPLLGSPGAMCEANAWASAPRRARCTHKFEETPRRDSHVTASGPITLLTVDVPRSDDLQQIGTCSLPPLYLDSSAVLTGGAGNDYQVATGDLVRAPHHLADLPNGVDDR